eukprot:scaffold221_cov351-Pavlova_lutheri.AAC.44
MEHASVQRDEAMEQDDAYESCKTTENNNGAEKRGVQLSRRKRTVLSKGELVQPSTLRKYGRWREALLMHCKKKDGVNGQYVHIGQAFPTMNSYHTAVESFLLHVHTSKDDDGCTSRELFGQSRKLPAKAPGKVAMRMDAGELLPRAFFDTREEALHRACFRNVARMTCRSALAWRLRAILRGAEYR